MRRKDNQSAVFSAQLFGAHHRTGAVLGRANWSGTYIPTWNKYMHRGQSYLSTTDRGQLSETVGHGGHGNAVGGRQWHPSGAAVGCWFITNASRRCQITEIFTIRLGVADPSGGYRPALAGRLRRRLRRSPRLLRGLNDRHLHLTHVANSLNWKKKNLICFCGILL